MTGYIVLAVILVAAIFGTYKDSQKQKKQNENTNL